MSEEVEPSVRITLKDVWQAQVETSKQVARLVDQLPDHIQQTAADIKEVNIRVDDHESRLRKLEARIWMAVGALSLIFTAVQIAQNFIPTVK